MQPNDAQVAQAASQSPPPVEVSPWWVVAVLGLLLALAGGYLIFDAMAAFSGTVTSWFDCVTNEQILFQSCGRELEEAGLYRERFPLMAVLAVGFGAVLVGPVPAIVMLNRFRNNVVSALVFFMIAIPYGVVAFLMMIFALIVAVIYISQVTTAAG